MNCEWHDKIFTISENSFPGLALEIFRYQYGFNPVYQSYVKALGVDPGTIDAPEKIPFLPVSFFKTDKIKTGKFNAEKIFESSGTTNTDSSRHHIRDLVLYIESFSRGFQNVYGEIEDWCIIGLLPSYLESGNSSLVFMVEDLVRKTAHPQSGFYLNDFDKLNETISRLEQEKQKTLLIGVTYALLDFAKLYPRPLQYITIMETGGMKGRREELTRMEVHERLKKAFAKNEIHSEYGMTELLSQAYAVKDGKFYCPPWMKVMIRDEEDPLTVYGRESIGGSEQLISHLLPVTQASGGSIISKPATITGAINIIDPANVHSCSFIATDDIGRLYPDGGFEVLGRMDGSDLRGCSLLAV